MGPNEPFQKEYLLILIKTAIRIYEVTVHRSQEGTSRNHHLGEQSFRQEHFSGKDQGFICFKDDDMKPPELAGQEKGT